MSPPLSSRRHKYGAVRTELDGYQFASKAEAKRYAELKLLEKARQIHTLGLQPVFSLRVARRDGGWEEIGEYRADFRYFKRHQDGYFEDTIEDVKGFKTPLYRWKKKHVEAQYGITVTEIT